MHIYDSSDRFKPTVGIFIQVYVLEFGKWSYRTLGQMSEEMKAEYWKYFAQLVHRTQRDATVCNEQGVIYIEDMDTFRLEHYASKAGSLFFTNFNVHSHRYSVTLMYMFISVSAFCPSSPARSPEIVRIPSDVKPLYGTWIRGE